MPYTKAQLQAIGVDAANQYGIDPTLFNTAIGVESGWNPNAYNPTPTKYGNAAGIAQFVPETAARYGITNRYDPSQSLWGAGAYLSDLYDKTGSWVKTLKTYGTLSSWDGTLTNAQQNLKEIATALDKGLSLPDPSKIPVNPNDSTKGGTDWTRGGGIVPIDQLYQKGKAAASSAAGGTWENIAGFFERGSMMLGGGLVIAAGLLILVITSSKGK